MQSQYVYLSDITQPLIALYFSVELSTLYKSAGFSFEYCLQFWTCIHSTNRVIVYFNLLWSVVYMLLNSTVSIWTKIRPSLAATRIHLEALPPGMQELSGSWTTQQHGSHQCEAPVGQELKGAGQTASFLPFFVGGWGFRMVIPTEKQGIIPHGFVKWLDSQSFESIEKNASVIGSERKLRSLNTIRIHTASLLSIDVTSWATFVSLLWAQIEKKGPWVWKLTNAPL